MLTLITTCRPFDNPEFSAIQRNAITSWTFLKPRPEIIVMGNEKGVVDFCDELNIINYDVEYSDHGTPMLDSIMNTGEEKASNDYILLVSSDVVLFQNTIKAFKILKDTMIDFCGVARKKQQQEIKALDFNTNWRNQVRHGLRWNLITSGDFFMYPKGYWGEIPPFIIGRTACDSWLFDESSKKGTLIDLTEAVEIIDYKHSYNHRPSGWEEEKEHNHNLCKNKKASIKDANWIMSKDFKVHAK